MDEIATLHFVMSLLSQNARNAMTLLIDEIATAKAFAYAKRTQCNDITTCTRKTLLLKTANIDKKTKGNLEGCLDCR